ncbi:hypothetical protein [Dysgonomonas sp. 25]|uniref:hypothetical protein n=1 Tax=Dysgonomonas sp. 25 TaxID=2302933 RepID=UPI0013D182E4|nr:hypothetical protein [Dysgonomonas sp. 25]
MKSEQILFFILLSLCILPACTDQQESNVISITGQFTNIEDGAIVSLCQPDDKAAKPFISDTIRDGKISISYTDTVPALKRIKLICRGEGFPPSHLTLWVRPGSRTIIKGDGKLLRTWNTKSTVKEQNEQNKYVRESTRNLHRLQVLLCEINTLSAEIEESPEKETELRRQINALHTQQDSVDLLIEKKDLEVMKRYPSYSACWMDLLQQYSEKCHHNPDYPYRELVFALYSRLPDEKKNCAEYKTIALNLRTSEKQADDF